MFGFPFLYEIDHRAIAVEASVLQPSRMIKICLNQVVWEYVNTLYVAPDPEQKSRAASALQILPCTFELPRTIRTHQ